MNSHFSENTSDIVVTWSTLNDTGDSIVEYGIVQDGLKTKAIGSSKLFIDGGNQKQKQYIHVVSNQFLANQIVFIIYLMFLLGHSAGPEGKYTVHVSLWRQQRLVQYFLV